VYLKFEEEQAFGQSSDASDAFVGTNTTPAAQDSITFEVASSATTDQSMHEVSPFGEEFTSNPFGEISEVSSSFGAASNPFGDDGGFGQFDNNASTTTDAFAGFGDSAAGSGKEASGFDSFNVDFPSEDSKSEVLLEEFGTESSADDPFAAFDNDYNSTAKDAFAPAATNLQQDAFVAFSNDSNSPKNDAFVAFGAPTTFDGFDAFGAPNSDGSKSHTALKADFETSFPKPGSDGFDTFDAFGSTNIAPSTERSGFEASGFGDFGDSSASSALTSADDPFAAFD
jgi:hypothetical protein